MRIQIHRGVEKEIGRLPGMVPMLGRVAGAVVAEARRIAPEREGNYKRGLEADAGFDDDGDPVGRANANWFTSHFIEFGTVHTPVFAPLRKAMESGVARKAL